jgi:hypothetical protein
LTPQGPQRTAIRGLSLAVKRARPKPPDQYHVHFGSQQHKQGPQPEPGQQAYYEENVP